MDYELLYEISKIDYEIMKLQKNISLREKKQKLEILRKEYNAIKKEYDTFSDAAKADTLTANKLTKELEAMSSEIEDQENKLYTSNNLKTIEIYQKNIDKLKIDIKGNEEHIYELINRIQDSDIQKKGLLAASEKIKDEFNALKSEFNDEKAAMEQKINELSESRNALAQSVDSKTLEEYERIKNSKGYGMARVDGEICSGCGIGIPALIINEAALEKKLVNCPNCERYIYAVNEKPADSSKKAERSKRSEQHR